MGSAADDGTKCAVRHNTFKTPSHIESPFILLFLDAEFPCDNCPSLNTM